MTTGERIKALRTQKGMTQEELGAKIGVKTPAIYKYENGLVVNLKRSTIEKLAEVLDTTPSYLMGFDDMDVSPAPMTNERITTGKRIKDERQKAGLTQKALADKLGVSAQSVRQWETGRRNATDETLQRIADALGTTPAHLSGADLPFSEMVQQVHAGAAPQMEIEVISDAETLEILRSYGLKKLSIKLLQQGIEQGVFPFGICIETEDGLIYQIFVKQLKEWIDERAVEVPEPDTEGK